MARFSSSAYARAKGRTPQRRPRASQFSFSLDVRGAAELKEGLIEIGEFGSKATTRNAVARGMIRAAQPMVQAARTLAWKDDGELSQSIDATTRLSAREKRRRRRAGVDADEIATVFVGPDFRRGAHGIWQEYGTEERFQKDAAGVKAFSTGKITAQPFMRPAFDSTYLQVFRGMAPAVGAELKKSVERARKKQARALAKRGRK